MNHRRRTLIAATIAAALAARKVAAASNGRGSMTTCCPVLELRQYTCRAGGRDTLIDLFERFFIEPQERLGAHIVGTFRDLDDPDRFVWMRGYADMATRGRALPAFYGSSDWQAHSKEANATMVDSDNVLLLKPVSDEAGFAMRVRQQGTRAGVIAARIHALSGVGPAAFARFFETTMLPGIEACGARPIARFVTETAANNFPALPVREHASVFTWFTRFDDEAAEQAFGKRLAARTGWRDAAPEALLPALMQKPELLRLSPTTRSALR